MDGKKGTLRFCKNYANLFSTGSYNKTNAREG